MPLLRLALADRAGRQPLVSHDAAFQATQLGDWDELFSRIAAELAAVVAGERDRLKPPPFRQAISLSAPLSPGELFDKLSILEIKRQRISDPAGLQNICKEWELLRDKKEAVADGSGPLESLYTELGSVNRRLWEIEDAIRACEAEGDFGPRFIELARSVYRTNDERTAIKRRVNEILGSELTEEKLYPSYQ